MSKLHDILRELTSATGEEYHKLHSGEQDFELTDARMTYYEFKAIKQIMALYKKPKPIVKRYVDNSMPEYRRGYNSGYIAGQRNSKLATTKGKEEQ